MARAVSYSTLRTQRRTGDRPGAEATLRALVTRRPDELQALLGLAEAIRERARRDPEDEDARFEAQRLTRRAEERRSELLGALDVAERAEAAFAALDEATVVRGDDTELLWQVAERCRATGHLKEAARIYRRYMLARSDDPRGYHMLAAVGGVKAPPRADDLYVQAVFDQEAGAYDEAHADDPAPRLVAALAEETLLAAPPREGPSGWRGADLGCGTGCCGERVRPLLRRLRGVDLAPRLLRGARNRGCYDELHEMELGAWLRKTRASHELVTAAGVLPFFGPLQPLLAVVRRRVASGGLFVFDAEPADDDVTLQTSGRYAHPTAHIEAMAAATRFEVAHLEVHDGRLLGALRAG